MSAQGAARTRLTGSARLLRPLRAGLLPLLLLLRAGGVEAQVPGQVPPDSAARADSLRAVRDSLQAVEDSLHRLELERTREALAGGGFPERDSVFRALAERPGYRIVEYRGREAVLRVPERTVTLRDSAQANYGEAALVADTILYRARLEFLSARGTIRLLGPDRQEMVSDSVLYYDVSTLKGTVLGAETHFAQGGTDWRVWGDAVPVGQRSLYVTRGSFTSCNLERPHYYFRAGSLKIVGQNVIVAWPVTLYVSDVPIFWLPFFAQDIRPDRRSGILPPRFGVNDIVRTSDGLERSVSDWGYYWAINEFMDAKVTGDWLSGTFIRMNGDFRYNVLKEFVRGNVNVERSWGDDGNETSVRFNHSQELSPSTSLRAIGNFKTSTRLFTDRSFDVEAQTQSLDSEVGLTQDFDFGSVSTSFRRRQTLSAADEITLTLPSISATFSPVTLFPAPRNRAGPFNNLTWSGNANFTRTDTDNDRRDDETTTRGDMGHNFRLGELSVGGSANVTDVRTTPLAVIVGDGEEPDTTFLDGPEADRTTITWNASARYQLDLMGSTTLSPRVDVRGAVFRSNVPVDTLTGETTLDTDGKFREAPTRISAGADLRTDLFAFFPGFGPFSRLRHKISPSVNWQFAPEVSTDSSLLAIPNFPAASGRARNELTVNFNQTFEAKMPVRRETAPPAPPAPGAPVDSVGEAGGVRPGGVGAPEAGAGGERVPADAEADADALAAPPAAEPPDGPGNGTPDAAVADGARRNGGGAAAQPLQERTVNILSVRSGSLRFDFERESGPALQTDQWINSFQSELLRGFSLNLTTDLLKGSGEERSFSPFVSGVNASFSLRSGQTFSDLIGLGNGGSRRVSRPEEDGEARSGGPWTLGLSYSLSRPRSEEPGQESQTLRSDFTFNPTPNWRVQWSTTFDVTNDEFGAQRVTLVRQLHRWEANFRFLKAPNDNFTFDFQVRLTDAPDLRFDFSQRSQ